MYIPSLIDEVSKFFKENNLDYAVVGFSGGIDSATTAALLSAAGIDVRLVLANAPNQMRESNFEPLDFARKYDKMSSRVLSFDFPTGKLNDLPPSAKEAALPILRNACFYSEAARLRDDGRNPIVVGTANFDEAAYLGFWGKASDGAQDYYPISHLHKSEVAELAKHLKVPHEIIDAKPSGDLLFSGDLNDYTMIGATYNQIEMIAKIAEFNPKEYRIESGSKEHILTEFIKKIVDDPKKFASNITKNYFKYQLPFPGYHLNNRLEKFRKECYPSILQAAKYVQYAYAQS